MDQDRIKVLEAKVLALETSIGAIAEAVNARIDAVEDTIEEIEKLFGQRVKELVSSETENKRENLPSDSTWKVRKEESLENLSFIIIQKIL